MVITRNGPLPNDPSVESPTRTRKTHKDDRTIALLQKLPIESKLRMNFDKQTRNAGRRERALATQDNISEVSSYITIPEEEYEKIAKDPAYFDRVKSFFSGHMLSWLSDKRKALKSRPSESDDTSPNANNSIAKRFRPNKELIDVDPSSPANIFLDDAYLPIGVLGYHIPLALFTNKNVTFLNNNVISMNHKKMTHIEGKPQLPEVADMIKRVRDSPAAGPTEDLDLEYYEWLEATSNYYNFQSRLFVEGSDAYEPQFYKKHFGFFENQPDSFKLYNLWKDLELELRQKHQNLRTAFDSIEYRTYWGRVQSRLDALPTAPLSQSSSSSSHQTSLPKPSKSTSNTHAPTTSSNSFPLGNKEKSSPCCIICGGVGHTFFVHNSTHGPPKWAVREGRELLHPISKVRLCTFWNIFGSCTKNCPSASHVCTFCGGSHPALKWDPTCRVPRPTGH